MRSLNCLFARLASVLLIAFVVLPLSHLTVQADTVLDDGNNTAATAQVISAIGTNNPVNASIDPPSDRDWYRINGIAGQTYVVEVFNVAVSLGSAAGFNCSNIRASAGLALILYDTVVTELKRECYPSGTGNIHNSLEITPNLDGVLYIQVLPGSDTVSGNYSIRVRLPTEEGKIFLPLIQR